MHMHADLTCTSELPFASFSERVFVQNVSHENDLILVGMNVQVTYIFIPIVLHEDSFCYRGKSKLDIGLFIHELLREPDLPVLSPRVCVGSRMKLVYVAKQRSSHD